MLTLTRQIAVRAAVGLTGLALLGAGLVLLLRSLWLVLVLPWGPMATAALMGGGLLLIGLLVIYLALRRPRLPVPLAPPAPADPLTTLVAAFVQGYGMGQALKSKR